MRRLAARPEAAALLLAVSLQGLKGGSGERSLAAAQRPAVGAVATPPPACRVPAAGSVRYRFLSSLRGGESAERRSRSRSRSSGRKEGSRSTSRSTSLPAKMAVDVGADEAEAAVVPPPYADKIRGLDDDWDSEWDGGYSEHVQPREKWLQVQFPLDLLPGETKHDYCSRLRPARPDLTDDQFLYLFHEQYWPEYKKEKRCRARRRGCGLRPHVARAFELDEAEPPHDAIPYSADTRRVLGEHANLTALMMAHITPSELVDAEQSPQHALWHACQVGADDDTIFDLAAAADINAPCEDRFNYTAAHFAAERGHVSVVEVLLALRADFERKDARGLQAAEVAEALRLFVLFLFVGFLVQLPPIALAYRTAYCMASTQKGVRKLLPIASACGTN